MGDPAEGPAEHDEECGQVDAGADAGGVWVLCFGGVAYDLDECQTELEVFHGVEQVVLCAGGEDVVGLRARGGVFEKEVAHDCCMERAGGELRECNGDRSRGSVRSEVSE